MYYDLMRLILPQLGCSLSHALANPRKADVVRARQLAWATMFVRYGMLYTEIGQASGHHRTTVIHGVKLVLSQRASSEDGRLFDWLMTADVETLAGEDLEES